MMLNRRLHLRGLFAVLLALMAQLGSGASMPRIDTITAAYILCHTSDGAGRAPSKAPSHPVDCPVCPLCGALHAHPAALIPVVDDAMPPAVAIGVKPEAPPPATAPPAAYRPPSQPRAPPIDS